LVRPNAKEKRGSVDEEGIEKILTAIEKKITMHDEEALERTNADKLSGRRGALLEVQNSWCNSAAEAW
jgi:hypothetical protein